MLDLNTLINDLDNKLKYETFNIADVDEDRKNELEKFRKAGLASRMRATDGSEEARQYVKNRIYFMLNEIKYLHPSNIDQIIQQYHLNYYKNLFSDDDKKLLKKPIDFEIEEYFQKYSLSVFDSYENKLQKLSQIIYQELYGYSILDELIFDSEFNEVACNRFDYIWIQYKGIKRRIPNPQFRFLNEEIYNKCIENRLISTASTEMNAGEPYINCTLRNGFRVTAARPPLSKYYVVSIRLFIYKQINENNRNSFVFDKVLKLIKILTQKGRRNIAIIGEMGSGKTTAADELIIKNLDDDLSIGLAENIHELNIQDAYDNKNVLEFQYGTRFNPSDITEMFFRFNRDIMIYGEVRSPMEAFEMIKAMLRQSRGSLFTFHSSSVRRMVHDLRQLLMQTGYYTDYKEARFDIADAVDLVIHIKLDRDTGKRYAYKVSEIIANEEDMSYEIRDLFIYNREKDKYMVNKNGISEQTLNSCSEYEFTHDDLVEVKNIFKIEPEQLEKYDYIQE